MRSPLKLAPTGSKLPLLMSLSKLVSASPVILNQVIHTTTTKDHKGGVIEPEDPPDSATFWLKLGVSAALVLLGGVFAG
jgi:metal transporter CNNM